MKALSSRTFLPLLLGDLAALAVMTVIGQQSHSTLDQGFSRFLVNFLPFALAWVAAAFCLEAYNPERLARYTELWRPFAAMILAAPGRRAACAGAGFGGDAGVCDCIRRDVCPGAAGLAVWVCRLVGFPHSKEPGAWMKLS
jgi:hypothetical protein